ncbi:MAG: 30S ribosomal protein S21 [Candidatus Levybacteria bacterium CG_4_10_14_0_2_um_filter_36_16]|nr:MAG: 30S ribosomal protein S21 [Candidatus Levybacteria bacterium CG2_30_37_29]PIR79540.1 MAG: 30S ribosomal protein S21 [Candidatus Levybacteria bacterium CG10_big_fil_rev_8_21_14_0_10_36_30]PIZ97934.1 MAG: 30S ribosomal protein S21 [Candidatus Levybacteria bacterium CG_4_10_14_0_2_um_filter_36_16]PJA90855.1 MAG: 30S ribosomal protein S21 [Candidatus Levybacteria bacterium CG_4_9_14_3_um_filter_36_7]
MVYVKKQPGDSADAMIRKFSRKVASEGIIQEMEKRKFYLKPSLAKKFRKVLARKFAKQQAWTRQ